MSFLGLTTAQINAGQTETSTKRMRRKPKTEDFLAQATTISLPRTEEPKAQEKQQDKRQEEEDEDLDDKSDDTSPVAANPNTAAAGNTIQSIIRFDGIRAARPGQLGVIGASQQPWNVQPPKQRAATNASALAQPQPPAPVGSLFGLGTSNPFATTPATWISFNAGQTTGMFGSSSTGGFGASTASNGGFGLSHGSFGNGGFGVGAFSSSLQPSAFPTSGSSIFGPGSAPPAVASFVPNPAGSKPEHSFGSFAFSAILSLTHAGSTEGFPCGENPFRPSVLPVLVQLIMQYLDLSSMMSAARTCKFLRTQVDTPFAWLEQEPHADSISAIDIDPFQMYRLAAAGESQKGKIGGFDPAAMEPRPVSYEVSPQRSSQSRLIYMESIDLPHLSHPSILKRRAKIVYRSTPYTEEFVEEFSEMSEELREQIGWFHSQFTTWKKEECSLFDGTIFKHIKTEAIILASIPFLNEVTIGQDYTLQRTKGDSSGPIATLIGASENSSNIRTLRIASCLPRSLHRPSHLILHDPWLVGSRETESLYRTAWIEQLECMVNVTTLELNISIPTSVSLIAAMEPTDQESPTLLPRLRQLTLNFNSCDISPRGIKITTRLMRCVGRMYQLTHLKLIGAINLSLVAMLPENEEESTQSRQMLESLTIHDGRPYAWSGERGCVLELAEFMFRSNYLRHVLLEAVLKDEFVSMMEKLETMPSTKLPSFHIRSVILVRCTFIPDLADRLRGLLPHARVIHGRKPLPVEPCEVTKHYDRIVSPPLRLPLDYSPLFEQPGADDTIVHIPPSRMELDRARRRDVKATAKAKAVGAKALAEALPSLVDDTTADRLRALDTTTRQQLMGAETFPLAQAPLFTDGKPVDPNPTLKSQRVIKTGSRLHQLIGGGLFDTTTIPRGSNPFPDHVIPAVLLQMIMQYLDTPSLCRSSHVSRWFRTQADTKCAWLDHLSSSFHQRRDDTIEEDEDRIGFEDRMPTAVTSSDRRTRLVHIESIDRAHFLRPSIILRRARIRFCSTLTSAAMQKLWSLSEMTSNFPLERFLPPFFSDVAEDEARLIRYLPHVDLLVLGLRFSNTQFIQILSTPSIVRSLRSLILCSCDRTDNNDIGRFRVGATVSNEVIQSILQLSHLTRLHANSTVVNFDDLLTHLPKCATLSKLHLHQAVNPEDTAASALKLIRGLHSCASLTQLSLQDFSNGEMAWHRMVFPDPTWQPNSSLLHTLQQLTLIETRIGAIFLPNLPFHLLTQLHTVRLICVSEYLPSVVLRSLSESRPPKLRAVRIRVSYVLQLPRQEVVSAFFEHTPPSVELWFEVLPTAVWGRVPSPMEFTDARTHIATWVGQERTKIIELANTNVYLTMPKPELFPSRPVSWYGHVAQYDDELMREFGAGGPRAPIECTAATPSAAVVGGIVFGQSQSSVMEPIKFDPPSASAVNIFSIAPSSNFATSHANEIPVSLDSTRTEKQEEERGAST